MSDLYNDGWLQVKEKKNYQTFWCVLKPSLHEGQQLGAELQFFCDQNAVINNLYGSLKINFLHGDSVALYKMDGHKQNQCKFTIIFQTVDHTKSWDKIKSTEMSFLAYEDLIRERWVYALCDLVGKRKPPEELPTKWNGKLATRPRKFQKPKDLKIVTASNLAEIMAPTNPAPHRGPIIPFDRGCVNLQSPASPLDRKPTPTRISERRTSAPFISPLNSPLLSGGCPWYYGNIDRKLAEEILAKETAGGYLLRDSSQPGAYSVSFKEMGNQIQHILMKKNEQGKFIVGTNKTLDSDSPYVAARVLLKEYYGGMKTHPCILKSPTVLSPRSAGLPRQQTMPARSERPMLSETRTSKMVPDFDSSKEEDEIDGYLKLSKIQSLTLKDGPSTPTKKVSNNTSYQNVDAPSPNVIREVGDDGYLMLREKTTEDENPYLVLTDLKQARSSANSEGNENVKTEGGAEKDVTNSPSSESFPEEEYIFMKGVNQEGNENVKTEGEEKDVTNSPSLQPSTEKEYVKMKSYYEEDNPYIIMNGDVETHYVDMTNHTKTP